MPDELEPTFRSLEGEGPSPEFVATLRKRMLAEAATQNAPVNDGATVEIYPTPGEHAARATTGPRWMLAGAAAAAVVMLLVGLIVVVGDDETIPSDDPTVPTTLDTVVPRETTTATTTTTVPPSAGTPGADADAGCGLSGVASVAAAVTDSAESVTIDVTSDPSCSGVAVEVVATPWAQGFPIEKLATLDETGAASVTDHLLGTRQGNQNWTVEVLVNETGGVAARTDFTVSGVCDIESADLRAEHLPETNEVSIVLTLDPACAGETFTFDRDGIFASSPPGGWEVYTVDGDGRIEVTEQLVVEGPFIDVFAIPVAAERGINTGWVARVTLDIGG